ncbi:MAG: YIP1 family protein [Coriobacteriia bacterium]|nr:YIP1 family protein [Coriobacteriia bacterium]
MDFKAVLSTPFRPRKGFESLSGKMAWVWVPCLVFLLLTLVARVTVETPRQIAFQEAAMKAQTEKMQTEMEAQNAGASGVKSATGTDSGDVPAPTDGDVAAPVDGEVIVPGDAGVDGGAQSIMWVSNYVFGILGLLAGVLFTSLLFFVAGKVWTTAANFRTFLSMTALAFVPYGLRDLVQAAYMTLADAYVRHPGLSSFAAPKDALAPGGIVYGLLGLADVWTLWATALLYVGLRFGIGLERKRALIAWGIFIGAVLLMRTATGGVVQAFSSGL